jgi:hypothetical protein
MIRPRTRYRASRSRSDPGLSRGGELRAEARHALSTWWSGRPEPSRAMRARGLEPPRPGPPAPKAGASTSSATPARAGILWGLAVAVAQLVVAPGCGPGGRGFESHRSPLSRPVPPAPVAQGIEQQTSNLCVARSNRAGRIAQPSRIQAPHASVSRWPTTISQPVLLPARDQPHVRPGEGRRKADGLRQHPWPIVAGGITMVRGDDSRHGRRRRCGSGDQSEKKWVRDLRRPVGRRIP